MCIVAFRDHEVLEESGEVHTNPQLTGGVMNSRTHTNTILHSNCAINDFLEPRQTVCVPVNAHPYPHFPGEEIEVLRN